MIRAMQKKDLEQVKDIYNHYIEHSAITFETNPYDLSYMQKWFEQYDHSGRYHAYVFEDDGVVAGFALTHKFKEKPAYQTSVEDTIYLNPDFSGKGIGSKLLAHLIAAMKGQDVHRIYAGITLPNDASIYLHEKYGFKKYGVQHEVGRKFDSYHHVQLMELRFD